MNQPSESARRPRFAAIAGQSERTILLGTVLLVSSVSAAVAYILTQWFGVNVVASLLNVPKDCWLDWHMGIGGHCFSDYGMVVNTGLQPNPWAYEMSLPIWQLPADYGPAGRPPHFSRLCCSDSRHTCWAHRNWDCSDICSRWR